MHKAAMVTVLAGLLSIGCESNKEEAEEVQKMVITNEEESLWNQNDKKIADENSPIPQELIILEQKDQGATLDVR